MNGKRAKAIRRQAKGTDTEYMRKREDSPIVLNPNCTRSVVKRMKGEMG